MTETPPTTSARPILLIGLGRGGIRVASIVHESYSFPGLLVAAADSDGEALAGARAGRVLQLGEAWTRGEGTGGDIDLAERATTASREELRALLPDARMVFVVAGLGGGIGSAAPQVLARLGREAAVPMVFMVTTPFSFEGAKRGRLAQRALERLREESEAVIAVPNSLLFARLPPDTASGRAFEISSTQLAQAVAGLARICSANGLLTADLAAVKRMVRRPGCTCSVAMGQGQGPNATAEALREFLASPFVGEASQLGEADAALLTLLGGDDLTIGAVKDCLEELHALFPHHAEVLVGAYTDPRLRAQVQLTGLLVRERRGQAAQPDLLPSGSEVAGSRRRPRRTAPEAGQPTQAPLPFPEQQLGIFAGSSQPTFHNGENLDIPTFQRRNLSIDIGETL